MTNQKNAAGQGAGSHISEKTCRSCGARLIVRDADSLVCPYCEVIYHISRDRRRFFHIKLHYGRWLFWFFRTLLTLAAVAFAVGVAFGFYLYM